MKKLKIGYSYWGFCENFEDCSVANTPDGNRYGRPILVNALVDEGHSVVAVQQRRETEPYPALSYDMAFPDIDVLFVEWRWPTWKNSDVDPVEPDLKRQIELMDHYHGKIPIIVWDTDLKLTPADEVRWPLAIFADPTFLPAGNKNKLNRGASLTNIHKRLTFWSDFRQFFVPVEKTLLFGYIGNNYDRDVMFSKYYSSAAEILRQKGCQTIVYGNWLQRSPERPDPEGIVQKYKHVAFIDRVGFSESMAILNKFICTVHITKSSYAARGFVSPRYLENIVCGTPALVPCEFLRPDIMGSEWTVSSTEDVVKKVIKIKQMTLDQRVALVEEQKQNLLKIHDFSVATTVKFIENVATNSRRFSINNL